MRSRLEAAGGEALYNARASTPEHADIFARWARGSAAYRDWSQSRGRCRLDLAYGSDPTETLDLFLPSGRACATLMYIHGGYWSSLDKSDASLVAPAFVEAGCAVAVVNYALHPRASIAAIVNQMRSAAAWLHRHCGDWQADPARLHACGHSAGGHLASMLLCTDWRRFDPALATPRPVAACVSVSGLYDLIPLLEVASIAAVRGLERGEAVELSPAHHAPQADARLLTAVGMEENRGFHDQADLIAQRWRQVHAGRVECEGRNHFTILDELIRSEGKIFKAALKLMSLF